MSLKVFLIAMTVVAVISDSLLQPFYPQYFATVFKVTDPQHVGFYIAACNLTLMLTFPVWAKVADRIPVLRLLVATQIATLLLSLACSVAATLSSFWLLSLAMMAFKASYLLIYPFVMSLEDKRHHIRTISLMAFVVHFGGILAALTSGVVFELLDPRGLFVVMAAGDAVQIALCAYVLLRRPELLPATSSDGAAAAASQLPPGFVYKLGMVMSLLYFSASLSEPFFSTYWEATAALDNKIVSGLVFAIPGLAALSAVYVNTLASASQTASAYSGIIVAITLAICGLCLQSSGQQWLILLGRFVYGWALFQSMVRLDLLLFRLSAPEAYAVDFGKVNVFQSMGVLLASSAAGALVSAYGARLPLWVAALGFAAAIALYATLFRHELRAGRIRSPERTAGAAAKPSAAA